MDFAAAPRPTTPTGCRVEVSDAIALAFGTIDVRPQGFGVDDPAATDTLADARTAQGGQLRIARLPAPAQGVGHAARRGANRLVIDASNVATVTIDPRARG